MIKLGPFLIVMVFVVLLLALAGCSGTPLRYACPGTGLVLNAPPPPPGVRYIECTTPAEKAATAAWQQRYIQEHGDPTRAEPLWMQLNRAPEDGSPFLLALPDGQMEWISRSGTP